MSDKSEALELAGIVVPQLASNIITSVPTITITQQDLETAISEITLETQTLGSPLLQMVLIDPAWKIQRSGLCDIDADGLVPKVDVNYPPGTSVWWRLAMVDGGNDMTQANLTLTFQLRIISYLQNCFGPFSAPPGTTTRAQFVKDLVDKMPREIDQSILGPGPKTIQFVCPDLNVVQPVAGSTDQQQVIVGPNAVGTSSDAVTQSLKARINKIKGIGAGALGVLKVRGQKMTNGQKSVANVILSQCEKLTAPEVCWVAIMYAAMGESVLGLDASNGGVFQTTGQPTAYSNGTDTAAQAAGFLTGGPAFGNGGAIALANAGHTNPAQIANAVENNKVYEQSGGSSSNPNATGDSYAGYFPGGEAGGIAEAEAIVNAYGGPGLSAGALAGGGAEIVSDVAQLARGTTDNPFEDSWTCIQRLAAEVNWDAFGSPQPSPGQWGNYLYYIAGTDLVTQKPACYISLSDDGTQWTATTDGIDGNKPTSSDGVVTQLTFTVDNTAFLYLQAKETKAAVKGGGSKRTSRNTRIRTPQTPTEVRFDLIMAPFEFNAGDVFVFQNTGAINGRWLVEDVTHNTLNDLFAQFTLGPPTEPYPEPQGTAVLTTSGNQVSLTSLLNQSGSSFSSTGGTAATQVTATGQLAGVAQAAQIALARQKSKGGFNYSQTRPVNFQIFGPYPVNIDCSGFAIACYKAAGLSDPSHNNYNGSGYTGDMIPHCAQISQGDAVPGDLCFFGPSQSATTHVNVYVGNGQSISMGEQGDPSQGPSSQMGPSGFLGFFRSDVAINAPSASAVLAATDPNPGKPFKPKLH